MTWYVAVLVMGSSIEGAPEIEPSVDLQIRLLQASDANHALQIAEDIGKREQTSYLNESRKTVTWKFFGLHDLEEIGQSPPGHGEEVYSLLRTVDPKSLLTPRDHLTVFWVEANKHRTVREILDSNEE